MKIRWTGESLRLRITPTELSALRGGEALTEGLALPGGRWELRLRPSGDDLAALWAGGIVIVDVPVREVARLAEPEREGVYGRTGDLRVMVEKDFPCAHPHADEAGEPHTERFAPTPSYLARKATTLAALPPAATN